MWHSLKVFLFLPPLLFALDYFWLGIRVLTLPVWDNKKADCRSAAASDVTVR